ncbi:hypothetical protein [Diaphorobacter sp. LR2014-1]|uniref:hypothetical protein n=2 Tax=Bacteria TaxID=2 RepID=UPI0011AF8448|nr:hypothetical protein [Diaphorobacter sp. LR2014-1]
MVTKLTGGLRPYKSYFLRRLLLQKGFPPDANAMARSMAIAADYDEARCLHLLSRAEEMTLKEVSDLCNKLSIPLHDFFLFFSEKKSVAPFIAKHVYTHEQLSFYVPKHVVDIPNECQLSWFTGLSLKCDLSATDIVIFETSQIKKPDTEHLHLYINNGNISPGWFIREKSNALKFVHENDNQISFPMDKLKRPDSPRASFHRVLLTLNGNPFHSVPPT